MRIPKDVQNYPPCRQCCCVLWRKSLFRVHPIGDTMVFEAIWLVRFQYHNQTYHAFIQKHSVSTSTLPWNCFLIIKRRMRRTTRRLSIPKPLWVYENATSLDELHAKNLAILKRLHTLLVLTVLKMLEATSFEKINTVKKWTRMQNKQCNGVCPFNSSDPLQV